MITPSVLNRILLPIRRKIFLLIGRAILTAVDNTQKTQNMKISCLKGENINKIERLEEYGITSYPPVDGDTECLVLFLNGNKDQGIIVKAHNREERPLTLSEGEVCLYSKNDNRVIMKTNGSIEMTGTAVNMLAATEAFIKGTTAKVEMTKDQALMSSLQAILSAWVPVPGDGGAALKAALTAGGFFTLPQASYANILSSKIKGE